MEPPFSAKATGDVEAETGNEDIISRIAFRAPTDEEIPRCFEIESASYPADEAATLESLEYRLANAGPVFPSLLYTSHAYGAAAATVLG